jgi:hypothetical protein
MHAAPSVSYPVGRSLFAAGACGLAALAGLAAVAAWSLLVPFGLRQVAAFAVVLACVSLASHAWLHAPVGILHWDGGAWAWEEGGATGAGRPEVALDLQSRLLLRWRGDGGGTRWLWLARTSAPSHWDALRRAVYSRASPPIPAFSPRGKERPPAGEPPAEQ